jgi:hypothetical protein
MALIHAATPPRAACAPQILGAETDDFDAAEFDTVDYINRHFPDEKSLEGIDRQIAAMDVEIRDLDESILGAHCPDLTLTA